jgi:uncharacterized protein YndB with AHSA1/START domain
MGSPVRAEDEILIDAPVDVVWSTLADVESWPRWNLDVSRASLHGPLESGTAFSWKAGGMPLESRLRDVSRPGKLSWTGVTFGIRAFHVSSFSPSANGTMTVTEESFDGFLPWLLRGPMRSMLSRSLARGLDALKAESERRARG